MEVHVGCSGWFYWHWRGLGAPTSGAGEAWIYFDNDREAFAIKNAHELIRRLREMGAQVW